MWSCSAAAKLKGWPNKAGADGRGMWHVWGRRKIHNRVLVGKLKEINHVGDLVVDWRALLKWVLRAQDGKIWLD
jgi:hypothetical protein